MLISTLNLSGIWMSNTIIDRFREADEPLTVYKLNSVLYLTECLHIQRHDTMLGSGNFLVTDTGIIDPTIQWKFDHTKITLVTNHLLAAGEDGKRYRYRHYSHVDSFNNCVLAVVNILRGLNDVEVYRYISEGNFHWDDMLARGSTTVRDMRAQIVL